MQVIRDIKSIPVLRPLIGFAVGLTAEKWVSLSFEWTLFCMFFSFLFLLGFLLSKFAFKPVISWITGFFVYLIFISAGILALKKFHSENRPIDIVSGKYIVGELISEPVLKNKYAKFEAFINVDSGLNKRSKAQIMMQVNNAFILPHAGQVIVMKTNPEKIPGPLNPSEFDYAAFLADNGILYRCKVKEGEWKILTCNGKKTIQLLALRVKNNLWDKIYNLESGNKNLGVLYAISLGSKDLLTPEIREAYAVTGAMHVLVVSGQHIALIWMVLSYIFIWVKDIPGGKYLQFFMIAGLIWFYTFMTGITASVVRASFMFTLISLGKIIQKECSIYNSLSISAFFGLLVNPQWLTDAGFQLSYLAVLSIVFFQPKIFSAWEPRYWLMKKIWEISAVSIAAQIGTLPLTLFYFNRFPPWFILSNIIVIPLVTLIMILFIILLIFMIIPFVFSLLLKSILFLIGIMNTSLEFIGKLPGPGMDMIYLNGFQMFCFIILLLGIVFFIRYRKNLLIILGLTALLFMTSSGFLQKLQSAEKEELIVFSIPGKMMIGMFDNNTAFFLHNSPDTVNIEPLFNYKCKPYVIRSRPVKIQIQSLNTFAGEKEGLKTLPGNQNFFCRFKGKSLLILNDPGYFRGFKTAQPLFADFIIINKPVPLLGKARDQVFRTNQLIISTSCPVYYLYSPLKPAIIQPDSIYDVRTKGYFRYFPGSETGNLIK